MSAQPNLHPGSPGKRPRRPWLIPATLVALTGVAAAMASRHVEQRLLFSRAALVVIAAELTLLALWQRERVLEILTAFFAAADPPLNLAIFRLAVFGAILNDVHIADTLSFSRMPAGLEFAPWGMSHLLPYLPVNATAAKIACVLLLIFCLSGLVGFLSRTSALACALLGFYVFGIPNFYGKVDHNHHLLWFALLLSASPCGDSLGIDALRARRKRPVPGPSPAYALPLRFVMLLMGLIYLFPGFWKVWQSGFDWFVSDSLRDQLYLFWTWSFDASWLPLARIDQHPLLLRFAAGSTVLFELSFLFLMFCPKLRPVAAAAGLAFHSLTNSFMQISFLSLRLCYVALVDWGGILRWVRVRGREYRPGEQTGTLPVPTPPFQVPVVVVGGLLLFGNFCAGVLHHINAWPFACYPTFASPPPEQIPALTMSVEEPSGSELPVTDLDVPYHRFYGLSRNLLAIQDAAEREGRLRLVWSRAVEIHPELRTEARVKFYLQALWIDPARWAGNPASERLLFAFEPDKHFVRVQNKHLSDIEWQ